MKNTNNSFSQASPRMNTRNSSNIINNIIHNTPINFQGAISASALINPLLEVTTASNISG